MSAARAAIPRAGAPHLAVPAQRLARTPDSPAADSGRDLPEIGAR